MGRAPLLRLVRTNHLQSSQSSEGLNMIKRDPQLSELLMKCHELSESIKLHRSVQRRSGAGIPERSTCDRLLELYFATFDTVFRVLHVPTFYTEYNAYWNDPNFKKKTFHQKLLLVLAIGTCFYYENEEQGCPLRSLASAWIFQAQQWLVSVFEMGEPDMDVLQISCLLLLARQVDKSGSELAWISADFPLRIAISEGYHLEPSVHFPDITPFEVEMRRRIWATILELSLQSSLDAYMPPPLACDVWDCDPPANIDDSEISDSMDVRASGRSADHLTQSSAQIMLADTVRARLKILQSLMALTKSVNDQEIEMLVSELQAKCRSHVALISKALAFSTRSDPIKFQLCLVESLNRRFLLALSRPSSKLSNTEVCPRLSKTEAIESSLRILQCVKTSSESSFHPLPIDNVGRLQIFGGGIFKHTFWHALALLCFELAHGAPREWPNGMYDRAISVGQECMGIIRRQKTAGDTDTETFMEFLIMRARLFNEKEGNAIRQDAENDLRFCYQALKAELDLITGDNPIDQG
jgi:hypothetical protein